MGCKVLLPDPATCRHKWGGPIIVTYGKCAGRRYRQCVRCFTERDDIAGEDVQP